MVKLQPWAQDLLFETDISCTVCESNKTLRVTSSGKFFVINYLAHPGYGICLSFCENCQFISTEFVHPNVITYNFESSQHAHTPELIRELHRNQSELCQRQSSRFLKEVPKKNNRILHFSAGRSLYTDIFSQRCTQLYIIDLVPSFRIWAESQSELNVIEEKDIQNDTYIDAFDVIILPNVVNRLSSIKSTLLDCSRILKQDGILIFETPLTTLEEVKAGHFGHEEINFFSENSLKQLLSKQKNFLLRSFELNMTPEKDPSTINIQTQTKNERISARLVMINKNPNLGSQTLHYNQGNLESIMERNR